MRVYRVEFSYGANHQRNYQSLSNEKDRDIDLMLELNGKPMGKTWKTVSFYRADVHRPPPDFWYTGGPGCFACAPKAIPPTVLMHLETAGELLSCRVEDWPQRMNIMNVTEVYNCLNIKETKWLKGDAGNHNLVDFKRKSHVFKSRRIGGSSLFRIPQGNGAILFCWERDHNPESEFKASVEQNRLKGIEFTLEWED